MLKNKKEFLSRLIVSLALLLFISLIPGFKADAAGWKKKGNNWQYEDGNNKIVKKKWMAPSNARNHFSPKHYHLWTFILKKEKMNMQFSAKKKPKNSRREQARYLKTFRITRIFSRTSQ